VVPYTLPKSLTKFGYQETMFMSFYRKSAGVLQDVSGISTGSSEFLQDVLKIRFWMMDEWKGMHEWVGR